MSAVKVHILLFTALLLWAARFSVERIHEGGFYLEGMMKTKKGKTRIKLKKLLLFPAIAEK